LGRTTFTPIQRVNADGQAPIDGRSIEDMALQK